MKTSFNDIEKKAVEENRLLKAYIQYLEAEIEKYKVVISIGVKES